MVRLEEREIRKLLFSFLFFFFVADRSDGLSASSHSAIL